jgi:outer membrane protein OmpA-like peptidoglycan-associated protein
MKHTLTHSVKLMIVRLFMIVLALLSIGTAQGQSPMPTKPLPKYNRLSLGLRINHLYDLKFKPNKLLPNGFIAEDMQGLNGSNTKFDIAFGADVSYFFSPLFSMDASFDIGKMTGAGQYEYYQSDVSFYSVGANINLKRSIRTQPYKLVPYFRVSVSNANYDVERKFKEDNITFSKIKDNCLQIGFGGGIRYHLSKNLHLNLMSEFVTSYTDAWDGFDYADGNDHMVKTSVGIRYTFGGQPHVDQSLAWQDRRVDDMMAGNNEQTMSKTLQAMSDSLRLMRETLNQVRSELNDKIAMDNGDNDKDGVLNRNDICPDVYGPTYNNGCPDTSKVVAKTTDGTTTGNTTPARPAAVVSHPTPSAMFNLAQVKNMLLIELNHIKFPSGKATLDELSLDILNRNAVVMQNNPGFKLIILGYTDKDGSKTLNDKLSRLRASAVANYLAQQGVSREQLEIRPMGSSNMIDKRTSQRGKANNRRVEFLVENR